MAYPTKLPGGRLVLTLDPQQKAKAFELDMRRAVGRVDPTEGWLEAFFCATKPVAMVRVKGPPLQYEFLRLAGPDRLGYEPADFGSDGNVSWMAQEAALGLKYAVVLASRRVDDETQLAIAITSAGDGDDPLALGRKRGASALDSGYDELFESRCAWWEESWSISSVSIPNEHFLAMQAVREMLLQSWGRTVRVFPAVSDRWADASFAFYPSRPVAQLSQY